MFKQINFYKTICNLYSTRMTGFVSRFEGRFLRTECWGEERRR